MRLLRLELRRERARLALVALAVAVCVATLMGVTSLLLGVYDKAVQPLLPRLPLGLIKVEGRSAEVGLFALSALGRGLDDAALDQLRALPDVAAVYPERSAGVPIRAGGGQAFLGKNVRTDVFATGVPPELVVNDVAEGMVFEDSTEGPLSVMASRRLLELYNSTVAPALNKPRVTAEAVMGFQFELILGTSITRGTTPKGRIIRRPAKLVGLSDRANLAGITVPEATVERWSREFGVDTPLVGAWVEVLDPGRVGAVASRIENAGLRVDETPKLIGWALGAAAGIGVIVASLIIGLTVLAIALAFRLMVTQRAGDLAIFRALGATPSDIVRLILQEALVAGTVGSALGLGAGAAVGLLGQSVLRSLLADTSVPVEGWITWSYGLFGAGFVIGGLSALLGAVGPAWRAARVDPVVGLRG